MKVEKEWIDVLTILIRYKFADVGTAESNADDICNIFSKKTKKEGAR